MSAAAPANPATETTPDELHALADVLDAFPRLTREERALIFTAYEMAPVGRAGWLAARWIDLGSGLLLRPYTLSSAAGHIVTPSRAQIRAALHYAAGILA
ncbi:hypothetical protein BKA24_001764 [Microbacterium marinum]|uniref:Uncharacterized protein n=1 Tax=Microbacterium marinum TaxID=421115 RepID=A0A7W7FJ45_9MICO|nr:hypothetical protein [Microbacterium marinum]MBB4667055.1 hypothetical protein [Microbacterium marinum]